MIGAATAQSLRSAATEVSRARPMLTIVAVSLAVLATAAAIGVTAYVLRHAARPD